MGNTFFDNWELERILRLMKQNPLKASLKLKEYTEKYPDDYLALENYAYILITIGEFEEAEKKLKLFKEALEKNEFKIISIRRLKHLKHEFIFNMLRVLSYQERYTEMYNFFMSYRKELEFDANNILFYCKQKLGHLDTSRRAHHSYIFKQITEYKEEDFLEHIKDHLPNHADVNEPNSAIFEPDFPIYEVIEEVKKYIPSQKRLFFGVFEDIYIFKYYNCGKDKGQLVNYFKVVCFHDTKNIITLCPSDGCDELPHVDLSYMIKEDKTKKLSQIDKFNRKYKI